MARRGLESAKSAKTVYVKIQMRRKFSVWIYISTSVVTYPIYVLFFFWF